jgi:hypothetical protein
MSEFLGKPYEYWHTLKTVLDSKRIEDAKQLELLVDDKETYFKLDQAELEIKQLKSKLKRINELSEEIE